MKKYLILLLLSSSVGVASAQDNRVPYLTRSLTGDGIKNVFVNTSGGSIAVTGGQEPKLEVYIVGNNNQNLSKDEIKKRLEEDYTLDISVHDGELHATAKQKHNISNWRRSISISFKVYVPVQVATNLNTSGGSITLNNLTGNQQFETSGGSLTVNALTGVIRGQTSGGSINLSNSKQDISLTTSGGSITASNCSGKLKLETSGGSLRLDNLKGYIHATTSGGSINGNEIDGELITGTSGGSVDLTAISGSLDASTSGGSVHAQMLRVGKYVKLETSAGHIDFSVPSSAALDLDLRADRVNYNLTGTFSGEKSKDKVVGKLNGGGARVEIRGSNSISVSSR